MSIRASVSVPVFFAAVALSASALAKPPHKAAAKVLHKAAAEVPQKAAAKAPAKAGAKAPAKAVHHPRRRSDRLDAMRTRQERNVQMLKTVYVFGRRQRPLAVFDINVKPFRFPVGTARYSPRDRRFLPRHGGERW